MEPISLIIQDLRELSLTIPVILDLEILDQDNEKPGFGLILLGIFFLFTN